MSFREYTFDEICEVITDGSHFSPKSVNIGKYMASVKDMGDYGFDFRECRKISAEDYDKLVKLGCSPQKGDVLIGKDGARYLEDVFIFNQDEEVVLLSSIAIMRVKKEILYPHYLYYFLCDKENKKNIKNNYGSGSAIPRMVLKDFKKVPISIPNLEQQKSIIDILISIDNKFKVNNQINKTLESMAQTLFKHWFVDFEFPNEDGEPYKSSGGEMVESELGLIPKGCEVGTLSSIAEITMGQSPKGSSYNEQGLGEVLYQGRTDFGERFPIRRLYTTEPNRMAKSGDVLMSVRAPVGDINFAYEDCCIGRGLCAIRNKNGYGSYMYYLMLSLKDRLNIYNGEGTVFGSINKDALNNLSIIKPRNSVIDKFDKLVLALDQQYLCLVEQNRRLSIIRDTLLPKLMSGEIRVPV